MSAEVPRSDRERLVASLGLPADAAAPSRYVETAPDVTAAVLRALVDDDVAGRVWRRWHPAHASRLESPAVRAAFQSMLAAGAAMGYSLDRFESAARGLVDSAAEPDRWAEAFERAIAARNAVELTVHLHPEVREAFIATNAAPDDAAERWDRLVTMLTEGLFYELGIIVPRIDVLADDGLAPNEIRFVVNDAQLPRRRLLAADQALVNDTFERLTLLNVQGEEALNPANSSECAIISAADVHICEQAGLMTWSRMGYAILLISATARAMGGAFVNRWLTECYCDRLAQASPTLVAEVKRTMSLEAITQVLRGLIDEEISIRNLRRLFEALAVPEAGIVVDLANKVAFAPKAALPGMLYRDAKLSMSAADGRVTRLRCAMARHISYKYSRGGSTLVAYLLEPRIEERLANPEPLSAREQGELLQAIGEEAGGLPPTAPQPVILTTLPIRLRLRREIAATFPRLTVLSYQELSPEKNIQPIARIALAPEAFAR